MRQLKTEDGYARRRDLVSFDEMDNGRVDDKAYAADISNYYNFFAHYMMLSVKADYCWNPSNFVASIPGNSTSVDSITSLLKEYLENFPVISVFFENIDGPFREIPLSIIEKQRVEHSWVRRSHGRLPRRISIRRDRRKDIVSAELSGSSHDDGTFRPENSIYGVSIIPHQDDWLDIPGDRNIISVSEERDIEKMYSKMFNYHSGRISLIENFVNALAGFTRFVVYGNSLHGAMFICGLLYKAMDELYYACGGGSAVIQCINWQTIMIQSFVAATQMFEGLQCCDDVAFIDKCIRSACTAILSVTEDVLKVFEVYRCLDVLSHLGELIVLWSQDSSFPIVFPELMKMIETRVFQSSITNSRVLRFAFELFASLMSTTCAITYLMDWSLSWPCGFGGTVTAFELIEALTTHIASRNWQCISVLERHLPFMDWVKDRSANETDPNIVITELVVAIRSAKSVDYLVHVSACVLNSNPLVEDVHHIILELVIPEIITLSENLRAAERIGNINNTWYRSFGSFRSLLNLLEFVLPAIDSYTAEAMIRAVISPYRHVYMKNRDLEDSFIMLTSKCISLRHVVAKESGLSDWLLTCVQTCYKRASQDIWRFMKDSAVKCNRTLFCALFIIHNALEHDLCAFDGFERRIKKQSWKIIELVRTSLHLSSDDLKVDGRISELVAISISLVLRIDRNARSQLNKFSNAFIRCLEKCLQSPVICRIIISVLIKILQFSPEKVKDIWFVINHDGIACILEIVYALLRQSCSLNTEHSFMVRKLCKLLGTVPTTQYSDQWLPLLFNVCEILIKKNVELETIDAVLRLLVHNIKHRPCPSYVSAIIGFLCMDSVYEVRHCIFRWFTEMLNDELRVPVSVVMPQRLAESPTANGQTIFVQDSFAQTDGRKAVEETLCWISMVTFRFVTLLNFLQCSRSEDPPVLFYCQRLNQVLRIVALLQLLEKLLLSSTSQGVKVGWRSFCLLMLFRLANSRCYENDIIGKGMWLNCRPSIFTPMLSHSCSYDILEGGSN
ncbi:unnamed protein product [Angiostrongylus costaricensis]|uniref:Non-specific serine/threonine protein kinase n=1 Tax=Angiostrongylus costaricensis TaxID=334426 RepID=A0A158PHN6_ANGCS|nr:unnamed protein product [Angiostrongylus costaricensis]